jgi:hypothetical protein
VVHSTPHEEQSSQPRAVITGRGSSALPHARALAADTSIDAAHVYFTHTSQEAQQRQVVHIVLCNALLRTAQQTSKKADTTA